MDLNTSIGNLIGGADGPTSVFLVAKPQTTAELAVIAVLSLLICLLGLKLFRAINVLISLSLAAAIGIVVISLSSSVPAGLAVMAVLAVALIVLSIFFRRFGAFVVALAYLAGLALLAVQPQGWILLAVCAAVVVVASALAFVWPDAILIASTALYGGWNLSYAALAMAGLEGPLFKWGGFALAALVGIFVQSALHSGKIRRKEVSRAQEVRKEMSKESEIDRARAILDEDDDEEE